MIGGMKSLNDGGMYRPTVTYTGAHKFCGLCLAPVTGNYNFGRHVLLCHGADYNQRDIGVDMEWMNRRLTLPQRDTEVKLRSLLLGEEADAGKEIEPHQMFMQLKEVSRFREEY